MPRSEAPVIGIPLCLDDRERWKPGRRYVYIDHAYVRAIEHAGGTALLLPLQSDAGGLVEEVERVERVERVRALVDRIDGLLLPGGDDFLPASPYPEPVAFDPAPAEQVAFDRALLAAALDRGRPVLGICYGAQLLALHHGGTLHHHLPLDVPASAPHSLPERDGRHPVHVEPGTRLAALVGAETAEVNSLHHQAIAEPGPGLCVAARSPDGVVEAVETTGAGFVVGVQWHPERLEGPAGRGLLAALVAASRPA